MTRLEEIRAKLNEMRNSHYDLEFTKETFKDFDYLLSRIERLEGALSAFVFDEEIPAVGKSYWLGESELKEAREALTEGEGRG